ncbi:MAG: thiamine-binding protein [Breznakibacter sp.]|nr:thiamine-binding protein [Breznakibacter sp.]
MKNKIVNIAIQILPFSAKLEVYDVVDKAIEVIARSGVKYRVTPFETVMEGSYGRLMEVVSEVQEVCYQAGVDAVMCNLKIQSNKQGLVTIEDKTGKYD